MLRRLKRKLLALPIALALTTGAMTLGVAAFNAAPAAAYNGCPQSAWLDYTYTGQMSTQIFMNTTCQYQYLYSVNTYDDWRLFQCGLSDYGAYCIPSSYGWRWDSPNWGPLAIGYATPPPGYDEIQVGSVPPSTCTACVQVSTWIYH